MLRLVLVLVLVVVVVRGERIGWTSGAGVVRLKDTMHGIREVLRRGWKRSRAAIVLSAGGTEGGGDPSEEVRAR
jgi:hypothetical protein